MNTPKSLVAWQWQTYSANHTDRANLLIHVFLVPVFWWGTVAVLVAPFTHGLMAVLGVVLMVASIGAQGWGHKKEAVAPIPFSSPLNALGRIFLEQWITFPRFLLSGGFGRAWLRPKNSAKK